MSTANPENVKRALALALEVCFATKDLTMLKQALDKGADAQAVLRQGHATHHWDMIDLALAAGADINASASGKPDGDTFLISYVRNEHLAAAQELLNRGADPNLTLGKESALEIVLTQMRKRKSEGWDLNEGQKKLSTRLLAALPDPQGEEDMALKKEVTLRAPQAAFKGAGQKPAP